jgi:hypothetical protein
MVISLLNIVRCGLCNDGIWFLGCIAENCLDRYSGWPENSFYIFIKNNPRLGFAGI